MRASKRARNQRADTVQPLPIPASIILPDDLKADIADTVPAFTYMQVMGGTCIVRGLVGHKLLREIGLEAKLTYGAILYRAGSDPMADVVAYCGQYNTGYVDNFVLGHLWTELGDDLIDFSCGEKPNGRCRSHRTVCRQSLGRSNRRSICGRRPRHSRRHGARSVSPLWVSSGTVPGRAWCRTPWRYSGL